MSVEQPVVFLSHGAGPSYYLDSKDMPMFKGLDKHSKAADFLRNFVKSTGIKKPEVILVISAHWEESNWTVNTNSKHSLYYDYSNFPPQTYQLDWTPAGDPDVARKVKTLLESKGIPCKEESKRGLDHGVFVPLKLVYPAADIPGFDVYDDCGIPKKALAHGLDMLDTPILGTRQCAEDPDVACTIGVIGASQSNTTESLLFALDGSEMRVIGPHATLPDLSRYQNYYRTVPTDDQQIRATVDLLKELGLSYIAIVHTNNEYGRYGANKLKEISISNGICVDSIQEISKGQDVQIQDLINQRENTKDKSLRVVFFGGREVLRKMKIELGFNPERIKGISWIVVEDPESELGMLTQTDNTYPNGTFVITTPANIVSDINTYIADKWNQSKYLPNDDLENLMKCSGLTAAPKLTFKDTAPILDAVFSFANSLQSQLKYYSADDNFTFRENFQFLLADAQKRYDDPILENVTVKEFAEMKRVSGFLTNGDFHPEPNIALYDIKFAADQNENVEIGHFRNNSIYFGNTSVDFNTVPSSKCNEQCEMCYEVPEIPFAFLDGETFILGIFSVHETDPVDPFRCSTVRIWTLDILIIETFLYSVKQARNETNINFGAIAIDDCYSAAQTGLVLAEVLSGKVKLTNPYTGDVIDVDRIAAVVLMSGSSVAIQTSLLLAEKKIPVVAGAASSPDLDDRLNFPYFLRTVPSDVEQARAMVSIIKRMGWEYVSVLYVKNNYGSKGKDTFVKIAKENGICIADEPQGISDVKEDELNTVFTHLRNQYSDVVVYFGTESRIADFLQAVNGNNKFIFLGSEDWADRQHVLDSGKNGTLGSITLMNDVVVMTNNSLNEHLKGLRPETVHKDRNPWFVEFWEETFECDLPQSFRNNYNKQCDSSDKFTDERVSTYVRDHRISHTSVAVKALTHGLQQSKASLCKQNNFPCDLYFKYIDEVVTHIRGVVISRGGSDVRVFNDDGNGNIGFRINNIQFGSDYRLEYKKVGLYNDNKLTLSQNILNFYLGLRNTPFDGSCHKPVCEECSNESVTTSVAIETTTHAHPAQEEFGIPDYTIIGILGFLVVISVVMGICIVCCLKKRIIELENRLKDIKYEIRTGTVYPPLPIANPGPSGDSMYEWRKAQNFLNGGNRNFSNGGIVNEAFDGQEMYIHPKHDDSDNQQEISAGSVNPRGNISPRESTSPRGQHRGTEQSRTFPESPTYRPPSSSYGLSTHHSFKKQSDLNNHHNGQIKKQPRTQLAVPPCRPELPPRDAEQPRMNGGPRHNDYIDKYDHLPSAVPKEKVRKVRSSPKRNFSPPSLKHSSPTRDYSGMQYRDADAVDTAKYNGGPAMTFPDNNVPLADMMNIGGSVEKISRV